MLYEDVFEKDAAVIRGLILQKLGLRLEREDLIIGVDPGSRIGLSISYLGREIESSVYSSVKSLVFHIIAVMAELKAKRKVVKIGDGDMEAAREIGAMLNLNFCSSFELEYVDEHNTSPKVKNCNQRGKRDRLSARHISKRRGEKHFVLPLSITG